MPKRDIAMNDCNSLPTTNCSVLDPQQATPAQQPEAIDRCTSAHDPDIENLNSLFEDSDLSPLYREIFGDSSSSSSSDDDDEEEYEEFPIEERAPETSTEDLNVLLDNMDLGPLYRGFTGWEEGEYVEVGFEWGFELAMLSSGEEDVVWMDEEGARLRPPAYEMRDQLPGYFEEQMPPKYEELEGDDEEVWWDLL